MIKLKSLLLFIFPAVVMASDLADIVSDAQNSEMIDSLGYIVKAQTKGRDAIESNYLPKIKADYMYQYLGDNDKGFVDVEQSLNIEASAVIFDGFRNSQSVKAQENLISSTKENMAYQKELLSLNAINLYFSIKTIQASIQAGTQKAKQLENDLVKLERFFKAKSVAEDKVEEVRAALAMTNYEIVYLKQNYQELIFSLETLTGKIISSIGDSTFVDKTVESEDKYHDINSIEYEIKALEYDSKTKTAQYWPSVMIKDTFSNNTYYELPSGVAIPTSTNKVQILASMTIFDFFAKSEESQVIEMQRQAKRSELSFKKREKEVKKRFAKVKLETLKAKISASEISFESSKKSFEFMKKRYEANLVDTSIYLDASSKLYKAKSIASGAKYEYQMALANYYFYNNIPLLEMIK